MVRSICQELAALPESVWIAYARSRDPLSRRVTAEEYTRHFHAAASCGMELAREALNAGLETGQALADSLGVRLERLSMPEGDGMLTFAMYHEPDLIQVFTDNAQATQTLIRESGGEEFLGAVDIEEMLLTHELFHVLQTRHPEAYVNRKLVRLWKIGPFRRDSALLSLEEVAAMAFAQTFLGLDHTPYVYDVLMLLPQATLEGRKLYERLLQLKEEAQ